MTDKTINAVDADASQRGLVPCPFVYANGRACTGHVVRVEAYKADITWTADAEGCWSFDFQPRSHYHVFCSAKGNHAGFRRQDSTALKFWFDTLPAPIRQLLGAWSGLRRWRDCQPVPRLL